MGCCYYPKAGGLAQSWQGHQKPITASACTPTFFSQVKLTHLNGRTVCTQDFCPALIFLTLSDCLSPQLSCRNVSLVQHLSVPRANVSWEWCCVLSQWDRFFRLFKQATDNVRAPSSSPPCFCFTQPVTRIYCAIYRVLIFPRKTEHRWPREQHGRSKTYSIGDRYERGRCCFLIAITL